MLALAAVLALAAAPGAHGHGIGYELLPPVRIGGGTAALEVTSSQYEDPDNPDREIRFALLEGDGGPATVRDVTYRIAASKGGAHLFELDFRADDGIFVLVLEGGGGGGNRAARGGARGILRVGGGAPAEGRPRQRDPVRHGRPVQVLRGDLHGRLVRRRAGPPRGVRGGALRPGQDVARGGRSQLRQADHRG